MLEITLFNFEKRKNSTKRPSTSTGTYLMVFGEVKEDFTPIAPVITFNFADPTQVPTYNYAYIPAFGNRYYFVSDWLYVSGLWRASMSIDVLATYRTEILASRQYVARSKTANPGDVIDASYPALAQTVRSDLTFDPANFWGASYQDGTIVMSVVGSSGYNIGANTYYAMSVQSFAYFMSAMLNNPNWLNISASEISQDLQKALIDPTQYITSCLWFPFYWEDVVYNSGAPSSDISKIIRCGWWDFELPTGEGTGRYIARRLHNPFTYLYDWERKSGGWTLPKHPNAATRGKWLNLSPYSKYTLTFPPFGVFDLDTTDLVNATELSFAVTTHLYTGDSVLIVTVNDPDFPTQNREILRVNSNIAVQIPVGQVAVNLSNFDNALLAGAAAGAVEVSSIITESVHEKGGGTTINGNYGGSHKSGKF